MKFEMDVLLIQEVVKLSNEIWNGMMIEVVKELLLIQAFNVRLVSSTWKADQCMYNTRLKRCQLHASTLTSCITAKWSGGNYLSGATCSRSRERKAA